MLQKLLLCCEGHKWPLTKTRRPWHPSLGLRGHTEKTGMDLPKNFVPNPEWGSQCKGWVRVHYDYDDRFPVEPLGDGSEWSMVPVGVGGQRGMRGMRRECVWERGDSWLEEGQRYTVVLFQDGLDMCTRGEVDLMWRGSEGDQERMRQSYRSYLREGGPLGCTEEGRGNKWVSVYTTPGTGPEVLVGHEGDPTENQTT